MCSRLNYFALKYKSNEHCFVTPELHPTCIGPGARIHQTRIVSADVRHLEGAHSEQVVDGIEVQAGRQGRAVGDLEPELGLDNLPWLVEHTVVLIWICRKV